MVNHPNRSKRLSDAVTAGLAKVDLLKIASHDIIDRADLIEFLRAAIAAYNKK